MIGGFSVSPTYRFGAGAGFRAPDDARDEDAFAGARPFLVGLVLLAMPPRYGGGARNARNDAAAGIRRHPPAGAGVGSAQALAQQARADGYARLCLSVERGNFAVTLYRSEGFAVTQSGIGRDTMVKRLR